MRRSRTARCPTCRRVAPKDANPYFPFCSERCRLIDLGKWAGEQYRIPGPKVSIADEEKREE